MILFTKWHLFSCSNQMLSSQAYFSCTNQMFFHHFDVLFLIITRCGWRFVSSMAALGHNSNHVLLSKLSSSHGSADWLLLPRCKVHCERVTHDVIRIIKTRLLDLRQVAERERCCLPQVFRCEGSIQVRVDVPGALLHGSRVAQEGLGVHSAPPDLAVVFGPHGHEHDAGHLVSVRAPEYRHAPGFGKTTHVTAHRARHLREAKMPEVRATEVG